MSKVSKRAILDNICILDVAHDFSIPLERASSGNFDYRCKCPSPEHKMGFERTSSCYIDSGGNNFYCFGCNANNNVIDFYILCSGDSFSEALKILSKKINPDKIKTYDDKIKSNNFPILMEISSVIRRSILDNPDDFEWQMNMSKKIDSYIESICSDDKKRASALLSKIKKVLRRRYGN